MFKNSLKILNFKLKIYESYTKLKLDNYVFGQYFTFANSFNKSFLSCTLPSACFYKLIKINDICCDKPSFKITVDYTSGCRRQSSFFNGPCPNLFCSRRQKCRKPQNFICLFDKLLKPRLFNSQLFKVLLLFVCGKIRKFLFQLCAHSYS